jgi:hypothetical protein
VLRDGSWLGRVAKGPYYFDHSAGADPAAKFEVRTVNGAGLRSDLIAAPGKAGISIDGASDAVVDTYSADDIWGVGVYSKSFPSGGKHRVKISVLGQPPDAYGTGTSVYLDGIQVEP